MHVRGDGEEATSVTTVDHKKNFRTMVHLCTQPGEWKKLPGTILTSFPAIGIQTNHVITNSPVSWRCIIACLTMPLLQTNANCHTGTVKCHLSLCPPRRFQLFNTNHYSTYMILSEILWKIMIVQVVIWKLFWRLSFCIIPVEKDELFLLHFFSL